MRAISLIIIISLLLASCSTTHYINKSNIEGMSVILKQMSMLDKAYINSQKEKGTQIRIVKLNKN